MLTDTAAEAHILRVWHKLLYMLHAAIKLSTRDANFGETCADVLITRQSLLGEDRLVELCRLSVVMPENLRRDRDELIVRVTVQDFDQAGDARLYVHVPTYLLPPCTSELGTERTSMRCMCGEPASKHCTGCYTAWYCSARCQHAAWRGHKKFCKFVRSLPVHMKIVNQQ